LTETVPDVLARIVAHKREQPAPSAGVRKQWELRAEQACARRRDFGQALEARTPALIAEIKKASPSRGLLAHDFDPARLARQYAGILGGADPMIVQSILRTRGTRPFYQVRIGEATRSDADALCGRIRRVGGPCLVLRSSVVGAS